MSNAVLWGNLILVITKEKGSKFSLPVSWLANFPVNEIVGFLAFSHLGYPAIALRILVLRVY